MKSSAQLKLARLSSPIGNILLVVEGGMLVSLDYAGYEPRMMRLLSKRYANVELQEIAESHISEIATPIREYLNGNHNAVDTLPVSPGGTEFQAAVWEALRTIPAGSFISYGELAQQLGKPKAVRAVGTANGQNPIAIVIPCHRVIGANGKLTGYAGGLDRKEWLLKHEGAIPG